MAEAPAPDLSSRRASPKPRASSGDNRVEMERCLDAETMAVLHLKWLQLHRQQLISSLQLSVKAILDTLVKDGDINPATSMAYQEIMAERTVPVEKARKFIDWLWSQPPTTFWNFQSALRELVSLSEANAEILAEFLLADKDLQQLALQVEAMSKSQRLFLTCGRAVLEVHHTLVSYYSKRKKIQMAAGAVAGGKTMLLDQIFVNISILSAPELEKLLQESSFGSEQDQQRFDYLFSQALQSADSMISLEDVFEAQDGSEQPQRVLTVGGAGCGKSVAFTHKVPYDWARGRLWQQFVLLFCLEFRDKSVWKAKTLAELLKLPELGLDAAACAEVVDFIRKHPELVVIVCDGLDEGYVVEEGLLWRWLGGNCPGVPTSLRLVVTSRPCEASEFVSKSCFIDRRMEVVGFTQSDVARFVYKYLGEQVGTALLGELEKQPSVGTLMHTPFFSLLICEQFKENKHLPDRKTEIFNNLIIRLLRRYARNRRLFSSFQSIETSPEEVKEMIISLGSLAFEGLKSKKLYFISADLSRLQLAAVELGLLTKVEGNELWKEDQYTFCHLTVQEFLAAIYTTTVLLHNPTDAWHLKRDSVLKSDSLRTFWVFVAGLLKAELNESFLKCISSSGAGSRQLLYECFHESRCSSNLLPSAAVTASIRQHGVEFVPRQSVYRRTSAKSKVKREVLPSASDCTAVSTVLKCHGYEVTSLQLGIEIYGREFTQLLPGLQKCCSLQKLKLRLGADLHGTHMAGLGSVLATNCTSVRNVSLSCPAVTDDMFQLLSSGLQSCKNLQRLEISRFLISASSCVALQCIFAALPELQVLTLDKIPISDDGLIQLSVGLQHCGTLRSLALAAASLTVKSILVLKMMLSHLHNLRGLDLHGNDFSEDDTGMQILLLSDAIQQHPSIELVVVDECKLTSRAQAMMKMAESESKRISVADVYRGHSTLCMAFRSHST